MNWKKHALSTHIAYIKVSKGKSLHKRLLQEVLDCFGQKCECPIDSTDTFSDGIYYHKENGCFAKFLGEWYIYDNAEMFDYYQMQLTVSEINIPDRELISKLCQTKFASKEQHILNDQIQQLKYIRKTKLEYFKLFKNWRNKK